MTEPASRSRSSVTARQTAETPPTRSPAQSRRTPTQLPNARRQSVSCQTASAQPTEQRYVLGIPDLLKANGLNVLVGG